MLWKCELVTDYTMNFYDHYLLQKDASVESPAYDGVDLVKRPATSDITERLITNACQRTGHTHTEPIIQLHGYRLYHISVIVFYLKSIYILAWHQLNRSNKSTWFLLGK